MDVAILAITITTPMIPAWGYAATITNSSQFTTTNNNNSSNQFMTTSLKFHSQYPVNLDAPLGKASKVIYGAALNV